MHKVLLGILFLLTLAPLPVRSQIRLLSPKESETFKLKVAEATKKTATIESDFIQEKELSMLSEKIQSKGKFYFKKDKMLRWEYTDPFPYLIIIRNDQLFVKDDMRENRININANKVFREINNILIGAIQGTLLNDTKNFQSSFGDANNQFVVTQVPLSPRLSETLSEIVLYFNKTDFMVEKLILRESSGDYTRIEFRGKKMNTPIPDEKFIIP